MAIRNETWCKRMAERSDLSASVVHLTRGGGENANQPPAYKILLQILRDRKINGSTNSSGFIIGNTPAVCFQDTPLYYACQNIHAEQVYRKAHPHTRLRYVGVGLMFNKMTVFRRGGRPVIYEEKQKAKDFLPREEWWRIVNYDLNTDDALIDWTHEREWRVPGDFEFSLEEATVVVPNKDIYSRFIKQCAKEENEGILESVAGVVMLKAIFF
jgi:hypothetical protein